MTSSSPKKRPTTARPSRASWTSRGLCAASLIGGCLAAAAFAGNPAEVAPSPAAQPVTVYYERMPDGTIRQVSTATIPVTVEKKADPIIKPAAVLPNGLQYTAPLPQPEVKTFAITTMPAPTTPLLRIDNRMVPTQREVITSAPAPLLMPPVNYSPYAVMPQVTAPAPMTMAAPIPMAAMLPAPAMNQPIVMQQPVVPKPAVTTPAAPIIRPVAMQQPAVLPGLPATNEPLAAPRVGELPGLPAIAPAEPKAFQPSPTPQPPMPPAAASAGDSDSETLADYNIETKPPKLDRLYRMDSETTLKKRITDEIRKRPKPENDIKFPEYKPLTDDQYQARQMGGLIKQIEPNYLVHERLYCEELNAERYGWDLGVIHPIVSSAYALKDFAFLPYNFATRPYQRFETNAGKCYPGDPVPYLLYPLEVSVTGAAWETGLIFAAFALVP